jgi:hypothetical protein
MVVHESHCPDVAIPIVLHDGGVGIVCLVYSVHAFLQIEPESHLASIQGRLLNVADAAMGLLFVHERLLVGTVRKEIAFEYHLGIFQLFHLKQLLLCLAEALVLSDEGILERFDV